MNNRQYNVNDNLETTGYLTQHQLRVRMLQSLRSRACRTARMIAGCNPANIFSLEDRGHTACMDVAYLCIVVSEEDACLMSIIKKRLATD